MIDKTPSSEFEFIRDKLERIARLLVNGDDSNVIEVSFMIGCLHSVCNENIDKFKDYECKAALHG